MRELIKPFLFLILLIPASLKCILCSQLSNGEYPYSDVNDDPAKGTGVCYKICEEIEITNGKWAPAEDKVYYNDNNDTCEYKLGCNDYDKPCYGFHPDDNNESCISNEQDSANILNAI